MEVGAECAAPRRRSLTCRQQWDELLALECSDPRAAPVHLLTVACYQLQHPRTFPLTAEARHRLRELLEDVVLRGRSLGEARDALQQRFDGQARVAAMADEPVAAAPAAWSMTVAEIGGPDPDTHVATIRRWATSVCEEVAT
jgi:hypothetical protein